MKKIIIVAILFIEILLINACSKKSGTATPSAVDPTITYAKDIAPIMTTYCTSCHSKYSSKSGVVSGISSIISSIQSGSMPTGSNKVSSAELTKLKTWDRVQ